jgi:hypothetical protein
MGRLRVCYGRTWSGVSASRSAGSESEWTVWPSGSRWRATLQTTPRDVTSTWACVHLAASRSRTQVLTGSWPSMARPIAPRAPWLVRSHASVTRTEADRHQSVEMSRDRVGSQATPVRPHGFLDPSRREYLVLADRIQEYEHRRGEPACQNPQDDLRNPPSQAQSHKERYTHAHQ